MADPNIAYGLAERMVYDYNRNPYGFSDEQGQQIARIAAAYGLDFKPESKFLKKFFYNLVNTGTLGALSLAMDAPRETGAQYGFGTKLGKAGTFAGTLGGMVTPIGAGAALGKMALRGASKMAPTLSGITKARPGLTRAAQWGATGAGVGAATGAIGDPLGAPERAFYGGLTGAALSPIGGAISRFRNRPESIEGGAKFGNNAGSPNVKNIDQLDLFETPVAPGNTGAYGSIFSDAVQRAKNVFNNRTLEDVRNAASNLKTQTVEGTKAAIARLKSELDSRRYFRGSPVDELDYYNDRIWY